MRKNEINVLAHQSGLNAESIQALYSRWCKIDLMLHKHEAWQKAIDKRLDDITPSTKLDAVLDALRRLRRFVIERRFPLAKILWDQAVAVYPNRVEYSQFPGEFMSLLEKLNVKQQEWTFVKA